MKILIVNDDGIESRGIRRMAAALAGVEGAELYICAPAEQQSGKSHSISMREPMEIISVPFEHVEQAYAISGTPADCVMLGLRFLQSKGIDIDIVFSGINEGSNLGTDTIYSGTVGAAMEGALCGKPSVAVSVESHAPQWFDAAEDLIVQAYGYVKAHMDPKTIININTPDLPREEIKGVVVTRTGIRDYDEWFRENVNADGIRQYSYAGEPVRYKSKNTDIDVIAVQEGYASVTPLMFDLTAHDRIEEVKRWKFNV